MQAVTACLDCQDADNLLKVVVIKYSAESEKENAVISPQQLKYFPTFAGWTIRSQCTSVILIERAKCFTVPENVAICEQGHVVAEN